MNKKKISCSIKQPHLSYEIEIYNDLQSDLANLAHFLKTLGNQCVIISSDQVGNLHGKRLLEALSAQGIKAHLFSFPAGEEHKNRHTKEQLEDKLFQAGIGKDGYIIGLGGGVVTDLAGYVAATYCRGVPLILMPTSLLAMVDASIGGKTGVNTPFGKNLVGTIYQSKKVVIDLSLLRTLPEKELRNGLVEMIKHGLIADRGYFDFLEANVHKLITLDIEAMSAAIYESCRIKNRIVEQDEKEGGLRRLLNFGHTIGHALETTSHYHLSHGEAVAIGICVESYMAMLLGLLPQATLKRIVLCLKRCGLPLAIPHNLSLESIHDAMLLDKKSVRNIPRFVLINDIGSPLSYEGQYCTEVNAEILQKALGWMCHDLRSY